MCYFSAGGKRSFPDSVDRTPPTDVFPASGTKAGKEDEGESQRQKGRPSKATVYPL